MKKICLLVVCAVACCWVVLSCSSCCHGLRWWLGIKPPPLPQQVITDQIGLRKVEMSLTSIGKFETHIFPEDERNGYMKLPRDFLKSIFNDDYIMHYEKIRFANSDYHIALDYNDDIVFVKANLPGKIVKKLSSPRSIWAFIPLTLKFGEKQYLVISIQNMPKTDSSVLFVLDEQLNVVYEEHDLYTYEIGTCHDPQYGDCLIVKTGNFHPPQETGDEKYWVYYLPQIKEDSTKCDIIPEKL